MIELQRIYEQSRTHGTRFLVERLWPRGIRKESLHFSDWLKDVAPSDALRRYLNKLPKGGHFAAWEQPKLFSEEVRAGFRSLRQGSSQEREDDPEKAKVRRHGTRATCRASTAGTSEAPRRRPLQDGNSNDDCR